MRILHVYKDYPPVLGGIENHVKTLAEAQAVSGHDVTVLVCSQEPRSSVELQAGVSILRQARLATINSMPISPVQTLAIRRLEPDVVHVHCPYPSGELSNWLFGRGRATVLTYHSDIVRQRFSRRLYGPLLRRVLRSADAIITTSSIYERTSVWLEEVKDLCTVVPLGVDLDRFTPPEARAASPPTLLFVGRLRYYKGVDTLLHALVQVTRQVPAARLLIVGDGPMRNTWRSLAESLELAEQVTFVGEARDEDLPHYYRSSDVLVLPSTVRAEAFGVVLLEGMACGLPLISTELGTGTSWVNQDGVTGRVVPPRDAAALSRAIVELLVDEQTRLRMGTAGRRRAEAEFSSTTMVERVEAIYRRVLR